MFYETYRLLTRILFALFFPLFLVYALLTGRHRVGLKQRLGLYDKEQIRQAGQPTVWLHGASVGEIKVAEILTERITTAFPATRVVVTTVTEAGLAMARQRIGNRATCLIAPFDLPGAAGRAIKAINPDIYLCLETELWPNTLACLGKSGAACFLLNARLSERSFRRYRLCKGLFRQVLGGFSSIVTITSADAERLMALGAAPEKVGVGGNIKYDMAPIAEPEKIRREWQRILGLSTANPVLVAGSTHGGEELLLLEVFRALRTSLAGLVLILAPRHQDRLELVETELSAAAADYDLLSQVRANCRRHDIVLVDSMGDLATLYSVATFIFCGGSLVERGGHNIIEAASWGRPVFYGPSMKDFSDAKELLETGGGGFQVDNAANLRKGIARLAGSPELYHRAATGARLTAERQNGAAERHLQPVYAKLRNLLKN